ncbi:MAG: hypothetical protein FJ184_15035, partial [Gammaproteobacteria bacterium]|nr:hypothetical protein [Gammaproteobacteria bacterium]
MGTKFTAFFGAATVVASMSSGISVAQVSGEAADDSELADVVITASRINRDGFQQPTPVTVVGREELSRAIPTTISNYLNLLPAFGRPTSTIAPFTGLAGSGQSLLNLRNLGVPRTLVLLDNRRVVGSPPIGGSSPVGVDINTLPMSLVDRVEVVTGGASAAWGADA